MEQPAGGMETWVAVEAIGHDELFDRSSLTQTKSRLSNANKYIFEHIFNVPKC
jgi:hypothetical protein